MSTPSVRAQIVEARTYLRPLNRDATIFETPEQCVNRVVAHQRWLWQRAKGGMRQISENDVTGERMWHLVELSSGEENELQDFRRLLLDRKVTVSGRTRWLGGTEVSRRIEASQFNPLPETQTFVTSKGVMSFEDCEDGQVLSVLTHTGKFRRGVVSHTGIREMLRLRLRRGRTVITQDTAAVHSWLRPDGERVRADALRVGDRLLAAPDTGFQSFDFDSASPDERIYWCYGFFYGDGTRKTLPAAGTELHLIRAFLHGYLHVIGLSVKSDEAADFVRTWAPVVGLYILYEKHEDRETNYGGFTGTRFAFTSGGGAHWTVEAVEEAPPQDCWCLTVDEDASFVLPYALSTGNCAFLEIHNVYDVVDAVWLLLQGCGVGFKMVPGALNGFSQQMKVEIIRSNRGPYEKGRAENVETFDPETKVWTIVVGDSSQAWARASGKLLAGKFPAKKLVIDFSEVRGPGGRLSSYGWISAGDNQISVAFEAIAKILNRRADQLLTAIDILDVMNWLGTILSSRRSAQIALLDYESPESAAFAGAKCNYFEDNPQRGMSNNSLMFNSYPGRAEIADVVNSMVKFGGSEPGFINAEHARKRAPWFHGVNPSLRKGTRVLTNDGIFNIEDLDGKHFTVPSLCAAKTPASCGLSGSNKRLFAVTLRGGHTYYATAEHMWPVLPSRKNGVLLAGAAPVRTPTSELSPGCKLPIFQRSGLGFGDKFSKEDGFFCGYWLANGSTSVRKDTGKRVFNVTVPEEDSASQERLAAYMGEYSSVVFRKSTKGKSVEVNTQNEKLIDLLHSFGVDFNKEKLPAVVWQTASDAFRAGFIDGMFSGDGYVDDRIGITNRSESLTRELAELLGFYGINTAVTTYFSDIKIGDHFYENYKICRLAVAGVKAVSHFAACFALTHSLKATKLNKLCERKTRHRTTPYAVVKSVTATDIYEDVWDLQVYDPSHSFFLAHCATGNCGEILLGDKSFCNLVETVLSRFNGDRRGLDRAHYLVARANYRQTCVNLDDGVLQRGWHELNEFLRLCGAGVTGVVKWEGQSDALRWEELRHIARFGANSMADELNMPRAKAVTTVKPSGTQSKIMGLAGDEVPEGLHMPMSRFIFNNVRFTKYDPNVEKLRKAGYHVFTDPYNDTDVLVRLPVEFTGVKFDETTRPDGTVVYVNKESAIEQLERYRLLMNYYVDHNASVTISYDTDEVNDIIDWLVKNWDQYVGVSFLFRNDVSKTAADLGYPYLPQEVVTEEVFREYVAGLTPVNIHATQEAFDIDAAPRNENSVEENDCATGACPIR